MTGTGDSRDRGAALILVILIVTVGALIGVAMLDRVDGVVRAGASNARLLDAEDAALSASDLAMAVLAGAPSIDCPSDQAWSADLVAVSVGGLDPDVRCRTLASFEDGSVDLLLRATVQPDPVGGEDAGVRVLDSRIHLGPDPDRAVTVMARRYQLEGRA